MKIIHGKPKVVVREADRYGHPIDTSIAKTIAQRRMLEPNQPNTKVFRCGPELRLAHILVPTDLTDESQKAVSYALHLAKLVGGELILLHLYDESRRHLSSIGVRRDESMLEDESKQRGRLYALRDEIRILHPNCNCYFYIGNPAEEIPKVAREKAVDLTVISTHHLQGSSRWIFGSDAARILSHKTCPILVV